MTVDFIGEMVFFGVIMGQLRSRFFGTSFYVCADRVQQLSCLMMNEYGIRHFWGWGMLEGF